MKLSLECYPCILNMVLNTSKLINLDKEKTELVMNYTMEQIIQKTDSTTAPHIASKMYNFIRENFFDNEQLFDPYKDLKLETNKIALSYFNTLTDMMNNSSKPLEMGVKIAAAGNIIDFGAKNHGSIDIDDEISNISNLKFSIFDSDKLFTKMKSAKTILYIGDNAGEIVFDKVFISGIQKIYPDIKITFAVRDKPIINDSTMVDAEFIDLKSIVEVISSGSQYPGTVIEETNENFKNLFNNADIIISKGQGNYETLSDNTNNNLFFLLRIKCDIVARTIGEEEGTLVLLNNS